MPSHRNFGARRGVIAGRGRGRGGKRRSTELREVANRYLLNQALADLEAYIAEYRNSNLQRNGPVNEQTLARLVDNKNILESLRDNPPKSTSMLDTVKCSLFECFDAVRREQAVDFLAESISGLRLIQD